MHQQGKSFQQLADEAFADLLKKHNQPLGIMAALKESVGRPRGGATRKPKPKRGK
jgi:hypothetical protein